MKMAKPQLNLKTAIIISIAIMILAAVAGFVTTEYFIKI